MKFKRMIATLLAVLCLCGMVGISYAEENPSPYYDVAKNFWGYEDVLYVTDQKLMMGVDVGFFAPNMTLSRSMLATVLWRSAGSPTVAEPAPFTDLTQEWYKMPVAWASKNGVVNGVGNGKFAPDSAITREQLVVMLYRYTESCGVVMNGSVALDSFKDKSSVSTWATDAMKWGVGNGLIKGMEGQGGFILAPKDTCTRAQAAAMIHRYEKLKKVSLTPQKPAYDPSKALKIVSYNIKCAWYGKTIDQVAEQLKEIDADIVGLQEVDCGTKRSKEVNQVRVIAEKAGYPYYYFAPVIDLTVSDKTQKVPENLDQNAYGHAILSKYPIIKSEIIWPATQSKGNEIRNFERHEIDVNGKIVAFYNCHLDFQLGREQYFEIQENYMSKDKYAICVGDFNETHAEFGIYFDREKYYNFSFGEDAEGGTTQVYRGENKDKPVIDHIIVSRDTITWKDDEVQNGYYIRLHDGASDHNMIYCYINLLD